MPIREDIPKGNKLIEDVDMCDRVESEVAGLAKLQLELIDEAQGKQPIIDANGDLIGY